MHQTTTNILERKNTCFILQTHHFYGAQFHPLNTWPASKMRLAYLVFPIPARHSNSRNRWQPDQKRVKVEHPEKNKVYRLLGNLPEIYITREIILKKNVGRRKYVPQMESLNHTSTTICVIIQAHKCATTNTH